MVRVTIQRRASSCGSLLLLLAIMVSPAAAQTQDTTCDTPSNALRAMTDLEIAREERLPAPPPPSKADAAKPVVNSASFASCSPEVAARARAPKARSSSRPARERGRPTARSAHAVYCAGNATTTRGSLRYVAHGEAFCSSPIELLADMNCVDLWASGGYWVRLSCGGWRTAYNINWVVGPGHGRDCTEGRTYRAETVISGVHHGLALQDVGYAPSHTCIR